MEYIRLAAVSDLDDVHIKSFRVFGKLIAIVKDRDGSFWATEIACKHQNADLSSVYAGRDEVRCPRHGWKYNIRTGECLNQNSAPLRRHGLRVDGEDVYVSTHPIEPEPPSEEQDFPTPVLRRRTPNED